MRLPISASLLLAALVTSCASAPVVPAPPADISASDPLSGRVQQIAALVAADPSLPAGLFDEPLVRAFPQIKGIGASLHAEHGPVRDVRVVKQVPPSEGHYDLVLADGMLVRTKVYLQPQAPWLVAGLWFDGARRELRDLPAAVEQLAALPGRVSFAACRLGDGEPERVAELGADVPLAIGSAFKLYVLGALADDAARGVRRWDDVVRLEERLRSLPSGQLQSWPPGSPVTLHTLASLMISRSDNTATDHLLATLGRERVEAMLQPMGSRSAARNVPFLSTAEMFRLKGTQGGQPGTAFAGLASAAERRAYLADTVAGLPLSGVAEYVAPRLVDTVEWFASASDLCRAMDWLRRATVDEKAAPARGILAINAPGTADAHLAWAGYKGGSEPGVLNLTWLARTKTGTWWAVSLGWNDTKAVDEGKLMGIGSGVLGVISALP